MKRPSLYWITCAVSLGGLLFGFDSGVISGCEEAIQREFALAPFWHGLVVAGALIGTVFGALGFPQLFLRISDGKCRDFFVTSLNKILRIAWRLRDFS